ncbi:MAG: hypothetical protein HYR58_02230 [Acidobacteria bacterium]|nr:hypothetical protein [Acidobacteriota bacterium]
MSRVTRIRLACLAAAAVLMAAGAGAERTRMWRQSNYDEFEKGTAKGVALRSRDLRISPIPTWPTSGRCG